MEALGLMLATAALPMLIGFAAAFTLSKFSEWSVRTKIGAAYVYHVLLMSCVLVFLLVGGWGAQLQSGVLAAFGVAFSMSQWRLATDDSARVVPAMLLLLYSALLFHLFRYELAKAFRHLF